MTTHDTVLAIDRSEVDAFDETTDVVIVGFGAAGTTAAFAAREAGAEVLCLERTAGAGGAAALAEGIIYLGGGTPVQRACGFEDSVENPPIPEEPATVELPVDAPVETVEVPPEEQTGEDFAPIAKGPRKTRAPKEA